MLTTRTKLASLREGLLDPAAHARQCLARGRRNPYNSFLTRLPEEGVLRASDPAAAKGRLAGLTVAIKDNIAVAGLPLTCASKALEGYVAPYHATVVERVLDAGGVILGKNNLDEFACGSSGESSAFGPTRNPRDPARVPGGSSSGSGASVAAEEVDLAIGSDTGGSVRAPAAFCGVAAFKPTYGLVSRYGLVDMCMGLEGPAPIAPDAYGCALLLSVMAGADPRDAVTSRPPQDLARDLDRFSFRGVRLGIAPEHFRGLEPSVEREVREALTRLEAAGATVVEVPMPSAALALPAYYLTVYAEFASAMQRYDGLKYGRSGGHDGLVETVAKNRGILGREVKRRILLGTHVTMKEFRGKWYTRALHARARVREDYRRAFERCDLLVSATMPVPPFRLGERIEDPVQMYAADVLTVSANLAGVPAGSVPASRGQLPAGLQFQGPAGEDRRVLGAMHAWEGIRDAR